VSVDESSFIYSVIGAAELCDFTVEAGNKGGSVLDGVELYLVFGVQVIVHNNGTLKGELFRGTRAAALGGRPCCT
jgi:hypothetical protein